MIGLEGSGFTICIGIILLLSGVVMYYCKRKITECEDKISGIFSIVSDLHNEVKDLKTQTQAQSQLYQQGGAVSQPSQVDLSQETTSFSSHPYQELIPVDISGNNGVNESSESESDTESEEDGDITEIELENSQGENSIKVVDLGLIEELKIGDLNEEDEEELPMEVVTEPETSSDEADTETEEETVQVGAVQVGAVQVGADHVEADHVEAVQVGADHQVEAVQLGADHHVEAVQVAEEKVIDVTPQMNYSKMQVTGLRRLVTERKLASNPSKLRKQELISLLEK